MNYMNRTTPASVSKHCVAVQLYPIWNFELIKSLDWLLKNETVEGPTGPVS